MSRKNLTCLVIHGGAGSRPLAGRRRLEVHHSLQAIIERVYPRLEKGMSAIDAVTLAVTLLENDPLYNAGKGSKLQSDGKIRMSASVMDGAKRKFGGCVNVEGVKNPILLAKHLMRKSDRVLSGAGAQRFAREHGLAFASPYTDHQRQAWLKRRRGKSGTVGAIALDRFGRMAAGTSTGGRGFEYPFRVSDSPTVAGNFANDVCAVSATGTGEEIVEQGTAATICAYVDAGFSLDKAVHRVLGRAVRADADFGLIALDRHGHFMASTTTASLIWAAANKKGKFYV